ncbi:MAG: hypothetical protein QOI90_1830 [Mycobacterium sp.]|nr:hypothetical protein [Mycobacterium sp.]
MSLDATRRGKSASVGCGASSVGSPLGAQQSDHRAQFVECSDAQGADGTSGGAAGRLLRGDLEGAGLDGDQAYLVGDDVVHLAGQLSSLAGEHRLRVERAFVFLALLDLLQALRKVSSCPGGVDRAGRERSRRPACRRRRARSRSGRAAHLPRGTPRSPWRPRRASHTPRGCGDCRSAHPGCSALRSEGRGSPGSKWQAG